MAARTSQQNREANLRRRYGITQAQYDALLAHQGGVCAICGGKRRYRLLVDHDHKTGRVRGLLCRRDNHQLLPALKDDPVIADRAVGYLMHPPADDILGQEAAA